MEPGNPKASRITTVRLGARADRRDVNPARCLARSKRTRDQCGRFPVKTVKNAIGGTLRAMIRDARRATPERPRLTHPDSEH